MAWGPSNIVGGGGLKDGDAMLRVQAPAGSTVTISKGTIIKTDGGHQNAIDPNTYDFYFVIRAVYFDSRVPWVVTATDTTTGSEAESTIYITDAYEYNLVMSYRLYLIKNGVKQITFTGNTIIESNANYNARAPEESTSGGYLTLTQPKTNPNRRSGSYATSSSVDVSDYNLLVLEYDITTNSNSGSAYSFVTALYANSGSSLPNYQDNATYCQKDWYQGPVTQTGKSISINVSSLSTAMIGIGLNCHNQDVGGTVTVNNLYLNP